MPFLVDSGPPVDGPTLQAARDELPREYGTRHVEARGRRSLIVRVPRTKPDYNYELADVAFYATLEDLQGVHDVLLVGDEKSVRMEPLRLRDHIREQQREDRDAVPPLRHRLVREYGWTILPSPGNANHRGLVLRLPVASVANAEDGILLRARASVGDEFPQVIRDVQCVYLLADNDFGRVGRRVFADAIAPELTDRVAPGDERTSAPLHLGYQTPGHHLAKR